MSNRWFHSWVDEERARARERGEKMFLGVPDAWFDASRWGCPNGHVSRIYLRTETGSGAVCLACGEDVRLCPPGTTESTLASLRARALAEREEPVS